MRNTLYGIFIVLCLFFFVLIYSVVRRSTADTVNYTLLGRTYKLLVADTPAEWEKGLMYARTLNGADGMLFIFPESQPRTFWNRNTLLNLRLYWINQGKVIGTSDLPSIEKSVTTVTVSSPGPVDRVVEILR